jgi:ABC-type multidrug transport system ATPase subunit
MTAAIETELLTKRFGAKTAVDSLTIRVERGSVCGFLGPNGAGKTTTIRMLLGLIRPTSGRATLLGCDIRRERARIAPRVAAIVEAPAFFPYLTALENLRVLSLASDRRETTARLRSALEEVGLGEAATLAVSAYSLGMRQRLGLAACLLTEPELVFLDEPTNGLDPAGTVEMRERIRALARSGRTVFLTSHLLAEVEQVCTDVVFIRDGRVRLAGRVAELTRTQGYLIRCEAGDAARAGALALDGVRVEPIDAEQVLVDADDATIADVIARLVASGVRVKTCVERRHALERLYLELDASPRSALRGGAANG